MTTSTEEKNQAEPEILADLSDQLVGYSIKELTAKPITMLLVREGLLKVRRTPVGVFYRLHKKGPQIDARDIFGLLKTVDAAQAQTMVDTIDQVIKGTNKTLKSMEQFEAYHLTIPKIPVGFMFQAMNLFRTVYQRQQTEAAILIRWSPVRQEHYAEIPEQDLSGGAVKYKADAKNTDPIVMDIHSHHTMPAFFSSIDDGDEKGTQFFAVVGNIEVSNPTMNIRVRMDGEDIAYIHPSSIFDGYIPDFPPSWMEKIKAPPKELDVRGPRSGRFLPRDRDREADDYPFEERVDGGGHGEFESGRSSGGTKPPISEQERGGLESRSVGDRLNDQQVLMLCEAVWEVVEKEIHDSAEIFGDHNTLVFLRGYIDGKIADLNPDDLLQESLFQGKER